MTGETDRSPSSWTPDSLKILFDEKISGLEARFSSELKRIEAVIAGQERAVTLLGQANQIAQDKFEATVRDGFVKQNEFRGSLDDLGKLMATRRETEVASAAMTARLDELAKQLGDLRSRIDVGPLALHDLQQQAATSQGRQQGLGVSANVVATLLTILIALGGLVVLYAATQ